MDCMDQMTISPGLKWLSCFDKLAYMVTTGDYQTKAVWTALLNIIAAILQSTYWKL